MLNSEASVGDSWSIVLRVKKVNEEMTSQKHNLQMIFYPNTHILFYFLYISSVGAQLYGHFSKDLISSSEKIYGIP